MRRIYDAIFAESTAKNHPKHIAMYWWSDGTTTGRMTPAEAHDYVVRFPKSMYVKEGGITVYVIPYHHTQNPTSRWIQTRADGTAEDNLVTLAKRHAAGLANI